MDRVGSAVLAGDDLGDDTDAEEDEDRGAGELGQELTDERGLWRAWPGWQLVVELLWDMGTPR